MKNLNILLVFCVVFSSCTLSTSREMGSHINSPSSSAETSQALVNNDTDNQNSSDSDALLNNNLSSDSQPSNNNELTGSNSTLYINDANTQKKLEKEDIIAQQIQSGMELCDLSQEYRENEDPENALKALDEAYSLINKIAREYENADPKQLDDLRYTIAKRITEIYSVRRRGTEGIANEIPLPMNIYVEKEIKRLSGREKKYFIRAYKRSGKYMPMILKKLKEADLPEELAWLPLIESGFYTKALSSARALGLWQFVPSTGHQFGLKRDLYIDERLDPEKSTDAAIAYFKQLHKLFGDWETVLAAYNCGEGRVLRTIRKQKLKYLDSFWDLYLQLPNETASYVPRFIATIHIVNDLEKYGFKNLTTYKPHEFETVHVDRSVHLKDIGSALDVNLSTLKEFNPALRYNIVPPQGYTIRVPKGKSEKLVASLKNLPSTRLQKAYAKHKVRRGETLSEIAEKYKTSVRAIMLENRLSKKHYIVPGQFLRIPSKKHFASRMYKANKKIYSSNQQHYKVRKGDSLWSIARKFNTNAKKIKQINNLKSNTLSIGQKLLIRDTKKNFSTYKVKPGDSPFKIASQHRMTLNRFLNINDMKKTTRIFPGQNVFVE